MKFNSVSVVIKNHGDEDATIQIVFDPPLPENQEDIDEQPCLNVLDTLLDALNEMEGEPEYLQ